MAKTEIRASAMGAEKEQLGHQAPTPLAHPLADAPAASAAQREPREPDQEEQRQDARDGEDHREGEADPLRQHQLPVGAGVGDPRRTHSMAGRLWGRSAIMRFDADAS